MLLPTAPCRRTALPSALFQAHVRVWLVALLVLVSGCATSSSLRRTATAGTVPDEADLTEPWQLPAGSFPTQRLYRLSYDGPEGKLDFKLTLYLSTPYQYRLQAVVALGRKLWDLDIDAADRVLWVDHREKTFCHAGDAGRLVIVPVAKLPLAALPKLLLGRLPTPPTAELARDESHVSYRDGLGQKWSARFEPAGGGALEWWNLEVDGEPQAWWRSDGDGGVFSDRRGRQQLRWKEVVSESLSQGVEPLEPPPNYQEVSCQD